MTIADRIRAAAPPERTPIRQFLIDYFEGDGDYSMAHSVIFAPSDFEAVRRTVEHFVIVTNWLHDEATKYDQERERANKAESAVRTAKQPLHKEMAELNKRITEQNSTINRLRVALHRAGISEPKSEENP